MSSKSLRNARLLSLLAIVIGLTVFYSSASRSKDESIELSHDYGNRSIVYNKLRHDDNNLQIFRKYQLEKTHEEKAKTLKLNVTFDNNVTKEITYTYYENSLIREDWVTQDDLIFEALDRTYKTRLMPANIYNYDDEKDRLRSSDPSITSASRCSRDLDYLLKKLHLLERENDNKIYVSIAPELAAFFDSFAGEEPGLLFGNYHWTGNWRQCYKRLIFDLDRSNHSDTIAFKGRYCTAAIRSSTWDKKVGSKMTKEFIKNHFKYDEQRYDYARFFRIQVGLCLPESCDSSIINTRKDDIQRLTNYKLHEPFRSYDLVDLFCLPDETSELRKIEPAGWLLILLAIIWCLIILIATYHDHKISKRRKKRAKANKRSAQHQSKTTIDKLVSALSLIKNYQRLTETESLRAIKKDKIVVSKDLAEQEVASRNNLNANKNPSPNDLLFLNAYKVISMPLIIHGHVGMLSIHLNRFPLDYESLGNGALFHFNASSVFFVDWYFIITGFITSYIMFATKKVERNKLFDWIYTYFHRYWRLAPLYIIAVWFSKYLFQHTSYGPIWDYGTSNMTIRSICRRESWLWPVFLASNWHPLHEECIMPAWYIANDMQFYILTPFILIGLLKRPIVTWIATLAAIGASIMARIHRYITDPRAQPLELMRPGFDLYMRNNWDMHPTYIYPHYRIPSYLIGILAGHYAYKVLKGEWRSPIYTIDWVSKKTLQHVTKNTTGKSLLGILTWFIGFYLVLNMAFASWPIKDLFPRSLEPQVKYFTAVVYGLSHSTTALGMALMIVSLTLGHLGSIKRFLSLPFWSLVSRINYIVFLIQVELIYWVFQSSERVPDFSGREDFKYWILLVGLCYSVSAILTLWIEMPLAHLEREFIGSWVAAKSKSSSREIKPPNPSKPQQCELVARETSNLVDIAQTRNQA